MERGIDGVIWAAGAAALAVGGLIAIALLAWLAGGAWMKVSRRWRSIFRAENDIIDYIRHRREFERWKKERMEP